MDRDFRPETFDFRRRRSRSPPVRLPLLLLVSGAGLFGHDSTPVTHSFDQGTRRPGPHLVLSIVEEPEGRLLPARFSIKVDGREYEPAWVDRHGIRFTSIHRSRGEEVTALYARGTGPVTVDLPSDARQVEVTATRGFEYIPAEASGRVEHSRLALEITLKRWVDLKKEGWIAVDEHLHYDRLDPAADAAWFTMMDADGVDAAHFMVLKGGMMPGIWARQFAYGPRGQSTDGHRLIVPGQEYRDPAQGHINLLGVDEVIEPISTGGFGSPPTHENYPPLHDVLIEARSRNAFTGAAHAGTLGRSPIAMDAVPGMNFGVRRPRWVGVTTHVANAVLGAVDFWELSNGFIYSTDTWYRLMNCGYFVPPAAGTDLPVSPFRDPWQPMLGATRTYVDTGGRIDFASFKAAMTRGRVFITGGPVIFLTVDGKGPGETVELPPEGGSVVVRAELSSPRPPQGFHLVHDGRDTGAGVTRTRNGTIHRWRIEHRITFKESGWIAAWGRGAPIRSQKFDAMAHTGAVRVLVGHRPVRSEDDLDHFIQLLGRQRDYYLKDGKYRNETERLHAASLFERAIERLRARLDRE